MMFSIIPLRSGLKFISGYGWLQVAQYYEFQTAGREEIEDSVDVPSWIAGTGLGT
jgi:hypothetical protein